jgi:hypothetical protein
MAQFSSDSFVGEEIPEIEIQLLGTINNLYVATEKFLKAENLEKPEKIEDYLHYNVKTIDDLQHYLQLTKDLPKNINLLDDQYILVEHEMAIVSTKFNETYEPFYHCKLYLHRPREIFKIFKYDFETLLDKGFVRKPTAREKIKYKLKQ